MKNFKIQYPADGTAALQPEYEDRSCEGIIIAFPSWQDTGRSGDRHPAHARPSVSRAPLARTNDARTPRVGIRQSVTTMWRMPAMLSLAAKRFRETDMVSCLCHGIAAGKPFNCAKRWEAVAATCLLSAIALACLLSSL